ncbi:MAG: MBL fold metallo-hydrolase [Nannocystaceae bacterium]
MQANPDLYFRQIPLGPMANFIYLIGSRSKGECMVVDPAWDTEALIDAAGKDGMKITGALVTHYHPDHCGGSIFGFNVPGGVAELIGKVDARIHVHKLEADGLKVVTGVSDSDMVRHESGDKIAIGDVTVELLHTPGHTPGSQCFMVNERLVAGDTLFVGGCGRVDLPGSDPDEMYASMMRLAELPDHIELYPGHDYGASKSAKMGEQKMSNAYLRKRTLEQWRGMMGKR